MKVNRIVMSVYRFFLLLIAYCSVQHGYAQSNSVSPATQAECTGKGVIVTWTGGSSCPPRWTAPPSATVSRQDAHQIVLIFPDPGTYTVYGNSNCGLSGSSTITVTASVHPTSTITASTTSFVAGTSVRFDVTATTVGTQPIYTWLVNGTPVPNETSSVFITNNLKDHNTVQAEVWHGTDIICSTPASALSNIIAVSVSCSPAPTTSDVSLLYNGSTALTAGGATGNQTYRWYNSNAFGVPPVYQGSTYPISNVTNNGFYYVSIYDPQTGIESCLASIRVTLSVNPPDVPTVSNVACLRRILTMGTPPPGVYWLWQGTNSNGTLGTDHSPTYAATTGGTYYLRAYASSISTWSTTSTAVVVGDINPESSSLPDIVLNAYDPANNAIRATHSIKLKPGFSVTAGNKFSASIAAECTDNVDVNWREDLAYDQSGNVIGQSRTYYSDQGNTLQVQSKDMVTQRIMAVQPLYDQLGQPVASTLPAPTLSEEFQYKHAFVSGSTGHAYNASDFDKPSTEPNANAPGELNNPNPVEDFPGTVGWYYSRHNNVETNVPSTDFPYSRSYIPPGPDPTSSVTASTGDAYKMGSGHESKGERLPLTSAELSHYLSLRSYYVPISSLVYDGTIGFKYIATDPDGKQSASFEDAYGHVLATAVVTLATGNNPVGYTYDYWSYNYYNDRGQLVASVAPNGVNTSSTAAPSFVTTYKYDHMGNVIEVNSPDEGRSQYVYSTDGLIRFSQNQVQFNSNPKRFSYTNYDYLGRLVESGEYIMSGAGYFDFQTVAAPQKAVNSVLDIADNVLPQGYNIVSLPSSGFVGPSKLTDGTRCSAYIYYLYDESGGPPRIDLNDPYTKQRNLAGRLSRTQISNYHTWYSYDEFGRVEWIKRFINGLDYNSEYKTIEYTYDFFGNVTEIAYQKGRPGDEFHHYYSYDEDQRLATVSTSKDGVNKTVQASYSYYLHGPVKRVELGTSSCKQGIDYVYTVNGQLKAINSSDPNTDPGMDGIGGTHAAIPKDFFGQTMHYNDADYSGDYSTPVNVGANFASQFGGNLQAVSYNKATEPGARHVFGYSYDAVNRLKDAQWGKISGNNATFSGLFPNSEKIDIYDKNGNIKSLTRKDKTGETTGDYTYEYVPNTNQVDKITQVTSSATTTVVDYTYDALGRVTRQTEGSKQLRITYNVRGKVSEVRDNLNRPVQLYYYDDHGDMVLKVDYQPGTSDEIGSTFYVRDAGGTVMAIYYVPKGGTPGVVEEPIYGASRIGIYKPSGKNGYYRYEMNDHLGNVRAVCAQPVSVIYPTVTFETDTEAQAEEKFDNYSSILNDDADHTDLGSVYTRVQTLNGGNVPQGRVGLTKTLEVSPGDEVSIDAYATYRVFSDANNTPLINGLASAFGVSATSTGEQLTLYNSLAGFAASVVDGEHPNDDDGPPKMFVTILLFDKNYTLLDATWDQVTDDGEMPASGHATKYGHLYASYKVKQSGYAYMFVSNEHPVQAEAYFDDVTVMHTESPIVAGSDYYPFGLPLDGTEITDEKYRYGYQGQYSEKDEATGWNQFELRMYDARFGRWLSPDPYRGLFDSPYVGMANQPQQKTDPDGGCPCPGLAAEVIIDGGVLSAIEVTASSLQRAAFSTAAIIRGGIATFNTYMNEHIDLSTSARKNLTLNSAVVNAFTHSITFGAAPLMNPDNQNFAEDFRGVQRGTLVATALVSVRGRPGMSPGAQPMAVTPVGNVPVTQPIAVHPPTVLGVHGQLNAEGPMSTGQVQKKIERGQAPGTIDRADKGRGAFEKDHIHFTGDDHALNIDGTWKHGGRSLSNAEREFIREIGWTLP